MEGEIGVTRSIIDELHSSDLQGDEMEGESMLFLEVLSMHLILAISNEIKWKLKLVLLEASLTNLILRIWSNGRRKWWYSKYHS